MAKCYTKGCFVESQKNVVCFKAFYALLTQLLFICLDKRIVYWFSESLSRNFYMSKIIKIAENVQQNSYIYEHH